MVLQNVVVCLYGLGCGCRGALCTQTLEDAKRVTVLVRLRKRIFHTGWLFSKINVEQ
jgi:hypothetical protein